MELEYQKSGEKALIKVIGKLTAATYSESLRGVVKELCEEDTRNIYIDMSELVHIDSTGVGELVSAYTAASNVDANLYLFSVPTVVEELLETTNLIEIFTILKKEEVALGEFNLA